MFFKKQKSLSVKSRGGHSENSNILLLFCLSFYTSCSLSKLHPLHLYLSGGGTLTFKKNVLRQLIGRWSHVVESHHAFHVSGSSLLKLTHHGLKTCHTTLRKYKTKNKTKNKGLIIISQGFLFSQVPVAFSSLRSITEMIGSAHYCRDCFIMSKRFSVNTMKKTKLKRTGGDGRSDKNDIYFDLMIMEDSEMFDRTMFYINQLFS